MEPRSRLPQEPNYDLARKRWVSATLETAFHERGVNIERFPFRMQGAAPEREVEFVASAAIASMSASITARPLVRLLGLSCG